MIYIETVMWHRDQAAAWGYHLHEEIPVRSCCGFGRRRAAFTGIIIGGLVGGHASEYRAYFFDFVYFLFFFFFIFFDLIDLFFFSLDLALDVWEPC